MPAAKPSATASQTVAPMSLLWVGNSFFYYNNSMHGHVGLLLRATAEGTRGWRQTSATISGSGLNWHDMEAHFKPGGMGSLLVQRQERGGVQQPAIARCPSCLTRCLMMDCSQCPIHPQLSARVLRGQVTTRQRHRARHGAEPILFMSWAYQDAPEMTASLADAYVGARNPQFMRAWCPPGLAFARSLGKRPDVVPPCR